MNQLFTIGYEGADLSDFIQTLKVAGVDVLLDVRELPISRRRGFSKTALRDALEQVGIDYRHEKQLGSPKTIRHRLREDSNYKAFFRDFSKHLNQQAELLEQLTQELVGNVALMCYERDVTICHRQPVAEALSKLIDKKPTHLGVHDHEQRQAFQKTHPRLSQSLSAA